MSFKLVTGYAGEGITNVTADDDASLQAGIIGVGNWAMQDGNELACTIINSNTVSVSPFTMVRNGVQATNTATLNLTIENGTSGVTRIDSIVAVFAHDNTTDIDTARLMVFKGTTSPPVITDQDLVKYVRIANITIVGLTPQAPVVLLQKSETLASLKEKCTSLTASINTLTTSIDAVKKYAETIRQEYDLYKSSTDKALSDTGWVSIPGNTGWLYSPNMMLASNGAKLQYRVKNGYMSIRGQIGVMNKVVNTSLYLFTIPSSFRSSGFGGYTYTFATSSGKTVTRVLDNHTDGKVYLEWTAEMSNAAEITGNILWISVNIIYPI